VHVVDGDHHAVISRQLPKMSGDAVDHYQRLVGERANILELVRSQQRITAAAQQPQDWRTGAGLLNFVALAPGDPDTGVDCLTADLRQQRRLSDSRVTRNQHYTAGTVHAGAADNA
jgi:hypothetical protein